MWYPPQYGWSSSNSASATAGSPSSTAAAAQYYAGYGSATANYEPVANSTGYTSTGTGGYASNGAYPYSAATAYNGAAPTGYYGGHYYQTPYTASAGATPAPIPPSVTDFMVRTYPPPHLPFL